MRPHLGITSKTAQMPRFDDISVAASARKLKINPRRGMIGESGIFLG